MIKQNYRSKCCNAKIKVHGIPDFLGTKEICTMSFSCNQCKKSCDVVEVRKDKTKTPTAQKRIREQKKRLDLQRETIQKLVGFFDGITIDPTKGVILTTKKKRQLKELLELLGLEKRSFSE